MVRLAVVAVAARGRVVGICPRRDLVVGKLSSAPPWLGVDLTAEPKHVLASHVRVARCLAGSRHPLGSVQTDVRSILALRVIRR